MNTDDPAMFGTDLESEHVAARRLGASPRASYDAAVLGALCDEQTRERIRRIGDEHDWGADGAGPPGV